MAMIKVFAAAAALIFLFLMVAARAVCLESYGRPGDRLPTQRPLSPEIQRHACHYCCRYVMLCNPIPAYGCFVPPKL